MVMIYAVGDISAAHFNPAVTVGFWLVKSLPAREVIPYISSQIFGGLVASLLLRFLFPQHGTYGITQPSITEPRAFVFETVLTFLLVFVILHVALGAMETRPFAGIAIGATVALEALFAGPMTGASMNPARSLTPALVSGQFDALWLYLTAPFLGALIAVFVFRQMRN